MSGLPTISTCAPDRQHHRPWQPESLGELTSAEHHRPSEPESLGESTSRNASIRQSHADLFLERDNPLLRSTLMLSPALLTISVAFAVFLSTVLVVDNHNAGDFFVGSLLRERLVEAEFASGGVAHTFHTVTTLREIYDYFRGPLLAALYVGLNVRSYAGSPLTSVDEGMSHHEDLPSARLINGYNRLLGRVRIQQVRVRQDTCEINYPFDVKSSAAHIAHCYSSWSSHTGTWCRGVV